MTSPSLLASSELPQPPGEMTLPEAIAFATGHHRQGRRALAMQIYERVLAVDPEHPDALHFLGIAHHQGGDAATALAFIDRSIAALPDAPDPHFNRGNVLLEENRFEEATQAYARAAELGFDSAPLQSNLGVLYRAQGQPQLAEQAYQRAIELDPTMADAHNNLGNLYEAMGRSEDAVRAYCNALLLTPMHPSSRKMLGLVYYTLGRIDEATETYRSWLAEEPDNPLPRHYLAACTGRDVPERAADAYVEAVFDGFANSFDAKLAKLTYRAPDLVAGAIARFCAPPAKALAILDAGCGTGLCGPLLAPYARELIGVDLSGQMLAKAAPRAVYDELVKAELTSYLLAHPGASDMIVSADTLCYFGALDEVLRAARDALRAGSWLFFTVEASVSEFHDEAFHLHPHGRYSHARHYVDQVLAQTGFAATHVDAVHLRMESGKPVDGWLIAARTH